MKFLSEMISKKKDGLDEEQSEVAEGVGDLDLPDLDAGGETSALPDAAAPRAAAGLTGGKGREFEADDGSYDWDLDSLDISDDETDASDTPATAEADEAVAEDDDDLFGDFMGDLDEAPEEEDAVVETAEQEVEETAPAEDFAEDPEDDFDLFADDDELDDTEDALSFDDDDDVHAEMDEPVELTKAEPETVALEDPEPEQEAAEQVSEQSSETENALRAALARLPSAKKAIEEEMEEQGVKQSAPRSSFIAKSVQQKKEALDGGIAEPALRRAAPEPADSDFIGKAEVTEDDQDGSAIAPDAALSPLAALRAKRQGELTPPQATDDAAAPVASEPEVEDHEVEEPAEERISLRAARPEPVEAEESFEEEAEEFEAPSDSMTRRPPVETEDEAELDEAFAADEPEPVLVETQTAAIAASADEAEEDQQPVRRRTGRVKTRLLGFHKPDETADPISAARARTEVPEFPVGWMVVVKGPGRGASFTLQSGASTIGRGDDQTVRLDFGDTSISRENHAVIAYDDEQKRFFLGHGGKANLVRLNDMPVLSTEPMTDGDTIRIGETTLIFVALCGEEFSWNEGPYADQTHAAE